MGEGEGGMIWENGIETCIISCMKRITSPGSMHDTGCLGLVHWVFMAARELSSVAKLAIPQSLLLEQEYLFRIGNTCTPVADSC